MKYIEKKYQQLIEDMNNAHYNMCDTLRDQIEDLKNTIQDKNEEIEKLKGGNKLQKEIDEYNRLEAQKNWERSKKIMHNLEPTLLNRTAAEQIDDYQMKIYEIVKGVFPDAIGYSAECSDGVEGSVKTNFRAHRSPIRLGEEKE